ncbi:hypothetical protein BVX93_00430, partial [bacterium B13(2017)]
EGVTDEEIIYQGSQDIETVTTADFDFSIMIDDRISITFNHRFDSENRVLFSTTYDSRLSTHPFGLSDEEILEYARIRDIPADERSDDDNALYAEFIEKMKIAWIGYGLIEGLTEEEIADFKRISDIPLDERSVEDQERIDEIIQRIQTELQDSLPSTEEVEKGHYYFELGETVYNYYNSRGETVLSYSFGFDLNERYDHVTSSMFSDIALADRQFGQLHITRNYSFDTRGNPIRTQISNCELIDGYDGLNDRTGMFDQAEFQITSGRYIINENYNYASIPQITTTLEYVWDKDLNQIRYTGGKTTTNLAYAPSGFVTELMVEHFSLVYVEGDTDNMGSYEQMLREVEFIENQELDGHGNPILVTSEYYFVEEDEDGYNEDGEISMAELIFSYGLEKEQRFDIDNRLVWS